MFCCFSYSIEYFESAGMTSLASLSLCFYACVPHGQRYTHTTTLNSMIVLQAMH